LRGIFSEEGTGEEERRTYSPKASAKMRIKIMPTWERERQVGMGKRGRQQI
jgi:hypothetical protein